jgi:HAD superfamily hydrolase (TIGR01509 family)
MPLYRGVIFDVDGTLIDSNDAHAQAWVDALAEHGHRVPFERVRGLIGMGGDNLLPEVTGIEKESLQGSAIATRRSALFKERYLSGLQPLPGAHDLVQRLRDDGLRLVVASSAATDELGPLLAIADVEDLLPEQTSSDDAESSKPDPDIVLAALQRANLRPDEAVMVGDTPYDIQAAQKAGVAIIALRSGGWEDQELAGALTINDDPADLLAHYDALPLARAAGEWRQEAAEAAADDATRLGDQPA